MELDVNYREWDVCDDVVVAGQPVSIHRGG